MVTQPGEYQVWVDQGIAMIGSDPVMVIDPNKDCNALSVQEDSLNNNSELLGIYDMMGRKVLYPSKNQIYIFHYNDGHCERQIIFE